MVSDWSSSYHHSTEQNLGNITVAIRNAKTVIFTDKLLGAVGCNFLIYYVFMSDTERNFDNEYKWLQGIKRTTIEPVYRPDGGGLGRPFPLKIFLRTTEWQGMEGKSFIKNKFRHSDGLLGGIHCSYLVNILDVWKGAENCPQFIPQGRFNIRNIGALGWWLPQTQRFLGNKNIKSK